MCGYIGNVIDSPLTKALMDLIGHDLWPHLRNNPGTGPAANIDIIAHDQGLQGRRAVWWLLLESKEGQFRPSRYTSFNTRSDKLNEKRSVGYKAYRTSRCVVPASYFIEGTGPKGQRVYHRIEPTDQAFALGGLYRTWLNRETGEVLYSCSVITLPPHVSDTWQAIHPKSTPGSDQAMGAARAVASIARRGGRVGPGRRDRYCHPAHRKSREAGA